MERLIPEQIWNKVVKAAEEIAKVAAGAAVVVTLIGTFFVVVYLHSSGAPVDLLNASVITAVAVLFCVTAAVVIFFTIILLAFIVGPYLAISEDSSPEESLRLGALSWIRVFFLSQGPLLAVSMFVIAVATNGYQLWFPAAFDSILLFGFILLYRWHWSSTKKSNKTVPSPTTLVCVTIVGFFWVPIMAQLLNKALFGFFPGLAESNQGTHFWWVAIVLLSDVFYYLLLNLKESGCLVLFTSSDLLISSPATPADCTNRQHSLLWQGVKSMQKNNKIVRYLRTDVLTIAELTESPESRQP